MFSSLITDLPTLGLNCSFAMNARRTVRNEQCFVTITVIYCLADFLFLRSKVKSLQKPGAALTFSGVSPLPPVSG